MWEIQHPTATKPITPTVNNVTANDVTSVNDVTQPTVDTNQPTDPSGWVDNGDGTKTYTYDDGSTVTKDTGGTIVNTTTRTNGSVLDVGNVSGNSNTTTYDDGSTLTTDSDGNVIKTTPTTDTGTPIVDTKGTNVVAGLVGTQTTDTTKNTNNTQNWYAGQSPWSWGSVAAPNKPGINPGMFAGQVNPNHPWNGPVQPSAVGGTAKLNIPDWVKSTIGPGTTMGIGGQYIAPGQGAVAPATYVG